MNNDYVNRVLDQAKGLQKTLGDAVSAGAERATPFFDEAVGKASDLKDALTQNAAAATEGAKPHIDRAVGHLTEFISYGKSALETGVAKAHEQLHPLAEHLISSLDSATAAMEKKTADAAPPPEGRPQP